MIIFTKVQLSLSFTNFNTEGNVFKTFHAFYSTKMSLNVVTWSFFCGVCTVLSLQTTGVSDYRSFRPSYARFTPPKIRGEKTRPGHRSVPMSRLSDNVRHLEIF